MPNLYAYASFHVEHVDKEYAAGAEPEAEFQEPEGQYEAADPEQEQEADFTDPLFATRQAPVHLKTRVFYTSLSFMQFI